MPVFRLDEKISQLISEIAKLLKKIWLPVTLVFVICLFGYLLYELVAFIHISKEEALVDRLFTLVESRDARGAIFSDQEPGIDRLVKDSKGSDSERFILKEAVGYLKIKASSKDPDLSFDPDEDSGPKKPPAPGGDTQEASKILGKIEEYARIGQEQFPKDEDMQAWASNVLAWIKAEREFKSKSMEKRSFAPVLPGSATPAPPAPPPEKEKAAAEAPQAPPASAAPPGEPSRPPEPAPAAQAGAPEKMSPPPSPQPAVPAPQTGPTTSGTSPDSDK